ncbi:hypothetical protein ACFLYO_02195 [Chloroflexota bacterium]
MIKKRGRPSLFTEETRKVLLTALSSGTLVKDACAMAGITEQTLSRWIQVGEAHLAGEKHPYMPRKVADRDQYSEFSEALKKARSTAQFRGVTKVQTAGQDRWVHVQTGLTRSSAPPPITFLHTPSGTILHDVIEANQYDSSPENWQKQWSGEAWQVERGDWRALAWFLERSNPAAWARRTRSDVALVDWRQEAEQAGLSPSAVANEFELLVQALAAQMEADDQDESEDNSDNSNSGPDTDV